MYFQKCEKVIILSSGIIFFKFYFSVFFSFSAKNINSLCNTTGCVNFDSLRMWGLFVDKG